MYTRAYSTGLGSIESMRHRGMGRTVGDMGRMIQDPAWARYQFTTGDGSLVTNKQGDPLYSYGGGGSWPELLNLPQYAVYMAANNSDPNRVNPVLNFAYMLSPSSTGNAMGLASVTDLQGNPVSLASVLKQAMDALVQGTYYPWDPAVNANPKNVGNNAVDASGRPYYKTTNVPGSNFYNDNIYPSGNATSPEQVVAAANSSNSTSTKPPDSGAQPGEDPSVTRDRTWLQMQNLPFEKMPLAAVPFWVDAHKAGLNPATYLKDGSLPAVTPTVAPASDPVKYPVPIPYTATPMSWASAPDLPVAPSVNPVVSIPSASAAPSSSASPVGSVASLLAPSASTAGTQSVAVSSGSPSPSSSSAVSLSSSSASGALDSAMAWVKENPLLAAGIAAAAVFMFSQGGRR